MHIKFKKCLHILCCSKRVILYFKKVALEDGQNMTENMIQVPENRKGVNIFITLIGPDWVKMRSFKKHSWKGSLSSYFIKRRDYYQKEFLKGNEESKQFTLWAACLIRLDDLFSPRCVKFWIAHLQSVTPRVIKKWFVNHIQQQQQETKNTISSCGLLWGNESTEETTLIQGSWTKHIEQTRIN